MSHKRIFSLESDDLVLGGGEVESPAIADSLRAEDEVSTAASDIQGDAVAIEEAADAAGRLEETADTLQESVDNGQGLDETAAKMTEVAVEAIMARIGAAGAGKKVIASVESFGGSNTRLHSTRASLEGVMDTIKSVWEKVKEWLKSLWTKITDFFTKFFDNTDRVKKALEATRERINGLGSKKAKESSIECKALADGFSVKGKFNVKNISEIFANHVAMTAGSNSLTKGIEHGVGILNKMVVNKTPDSKDVDAFRQAAVDMVTSLSLAKSPTKKDKTSKDGVEKTTVTQGPYYGGRFITLSASASENKGLISIQMEVQDAQPAETAKIAVLTQAEMNDACDAVEELNKMTADFKKNQAFFKKLHTEMDNIIGSAFRVMDAVTGQNDSAADLKRNLSVAKAGLSSISAVSARYVTMTPSWNVAICNKVLTGVNDCVKVYK